MPKLLVVAAALLLAAWGAGQMTLVTSIHPYYDLVRRLAGDRAETVRLLPPGSSPHRFDPSPRDVAVVAGADLIVVNGVLDVWLEDLIAASGSRADVVEILQVIDLSSVAGGHDHDLRGVPGGPEGVDPHVWLDPLLMVEAVTLLADRLVALDPAGADLYRANENRLREDLIALDEEVRDMLAPVAGMPFVPFHDAWTYFAEHYDLDLLVEIEPFPGREPSPAYLIEALRLIAETGAKAVFGERQLGPRPAEVVAESAGVALYILDPIGGSEGLESYEDMLRYNARVIAAALGNGTDR